MNTADREALRQQMLLRALWQDARPGVLAGWTRDGEAFTRGLQAYRPTPARWQNVPWPRPTPRCKQLIGEESFAGLARAFWHQHAPQRGDMALWGAELPAFIAAAEQLAGEPYLADVARLEWAVHRAQTAADATAALGLQALAGLDAPLRVLQAQPGTALVKSAHPVVSIWQAHRATGPDRYDGARQALAEQRPETALVWREGWVVRVAALPAAEAAFTHAVLQPLALGMALAAAGPAFDFEAWLIQTLQRGWLAGVAPDGAV
jgi:hypothetical protein